MTDDYDSRFAALQRNYLERVAEDLDRLIELQTMLGEAEAGDEVYGIVHRLAGTGGTMGFPAIGEAAVDLEELLEREEASVDEREAAVEVFCDEVRDVLEAESP